MRKTAALALRFANDDELPRELAAAEIHGSPAIAIHETNSHEWRVFYPTISERDAAGAALADFCRAHGILVEPIDIEDDEDWARRSQAQLKAIRIGDIIVAPPWDVPSNLSAFRNARGAPPPLARARRRGSAALPSGASRGPQALPVLIIIEPSTGFGTGHHASTRLCLLAMQRIDLRGLRVIDVGTGSGVLAIAAAKLGARHVVAIDTDADAIQNARENVARNFPDLLPGPSSTFADLLELRVADVASFGGAPADLVVANLTAVWLRRLAAPITALVRPGGTLIVSGLQDEDTTTVMDGLGESTAACDTLSEEGWTAVILRTLR